MVSIETTWSSAPPVAAEYVNRLLHEIDHPVTITPSGAQFQHEHYQRVEGAVRAALPPRLALGEHGEPIRLAPAQPSARLEDRLADRLAAAIAAAPTVARAISKAVNLSSLSAPRADDVGATTTRPARPYSNRPPVYPTEAITHRQEGNVRLRLHVTAAGRVDDVDVLESSGHPVLDAAAVRAARSWRFEPARRGDTPTSCWFEKTFEFVLRGS